MNTKQSLLVEGQNLMVRFCKVNDMPLPNFTVCRGPWDFSACAYYRPTRGIVINVTKCAHIGTGGASWSFPGYFIDRTPYGVIQHELGHHADWLAGESKGSYFSDFSVKARKESGEERITSYCPNDAEWFAEMFRVFVTNSDLLKVMRPRTYELFCKHWQPVVNLPWREVLAAAPERNVRQCEKWDKGPALLI